MQIVTLTIPADQAGFLNSAVAVSLEESIPSIPLTIIKSSGVGSGFVGERDVYCVLPETMTSRPGSLWSVEFFEDTILKYTKVVTIDIDTMAYVNGLSAEILMLTKRVLQLTEGNTKGGWLGEEGNRSVIVNDKNGNAIQEILVSGNERESFHELAIVRSGNVPVHPLTSFIGAEGEEVRDERETDIYTTPVEWNISLIDATVSSTATSTKLPLYGILPTSEKRVLGPIIKEGDTTLLAFAFEIKEEDLDKTLNITIRDEDGGFLYSRHNVYSMIAQNGEYVLSELQHPGNFSWETDCSFETPTTYIVTMSVDRGVTKPYFLEYQFTRGISTNVVTAVEVGASHFSVVLGAESNAKMKFTWTGGTLAMRVTRGDSDVDTELIIEDLDGNRIFRNDDTNEPNYDGHNYDSRLDMTLEAGDFYVLPRSLNFNDDSDLGETLVFETSAPIMIQPAEIGTITPVAGNPEIVYNASIASTRLGD